MVINSQRCLVVVEFFREDFLEGQEIINLLLKVNPTQRSGSLMSAAAIIISITMQAGEMMIMFFMPVIYRKEPVLGSINTKMERSLIYFPQRCNPKAALRFVAA